MTEGRPPIPASTKRIVRQRCGFGCVFCGLPLYEYDHMGGYSPAVGHDPDEITLLCPDHHSQKTRGLLTEADVRRANASPVNIREGRTAPFGLNGGDRG
jgi:trigger factor